MLKKEKNKILLWFGIVSIACLFISVQVYMIMLLLGVGFNLHYATSIAKSYVLQITPTLIAIPTSIFSYFLGKKIGQIENQEFKEDDK